MPEFRHRSGCAPPVCSNLSDLPHFPTDEGEAKLDSLDRTSRRGFAFNCLTSYSNADKMRGDLYYADPCKLFDYCKRKYSKNVALLHDYGLYDFTIISAKGYLVLCCSYFVKTRSNSWEVLGKL